MTSAPASSRSGSAPSGSGAVVAVAHANIALAKYWGKADDANNIPAVPSLSLTLGALTTRTRVDLDARLAEDAVVLDAIAATGRARERVVAMLDALRARVRSTVRARVSSSNDFPTAAGLASSASGFAALALAASNAYGLALDESELSALARRASASAARSVLGGYVELRQGAQAAERLLPGSELPLVMLVAVTVRGKKSVGSTEGMRHTRATSPYYAAWLEQAPAIYERVRAGVLARDLEAIGTAMEESALTMHASMLAARPAIVYFAPATLAAMEAVRTLRRAGTLAYFTMDAGPHVKVLTRSESADAVERALAAVPGVSSVLRSGPGGDARLEPEGG